MRICITVLLGVSLAAASTAAKAPNFIIIYMDDFEGREQKAHKRRMAELETRMPADYEEQKAKLLEEHEMKKRHFFANRTITKRQENWPGWYNTARKTVEAEIGITKGGKLIIK